MKPSTILDKAADLIMKKGWCQRELHKAGDGYCIEGAVREIDANGFQKVIKFIENATGEIGWYERIPHVWNDVDGRTKRQVIAALRKAAKNARKVGQ